MRALVKSVIKSLFGASYHTCVFNMACVGMWECDCMPFPSRPDYSSCIKGLALIFQHWKQINAKGNNINGLGWNVIKGYLNSAKFDKR